MQSIKDINTSTPEGKMLWAAIIIMTQSPALNIMGERVRGSKMEPDAILQKVQAAADELEKNKLFPGQKYDDAGTGEKPKEEVKSEGDGAGGSTETTK